MTQKLTLRALVPELLRGDASSEGGLAVHQLREREARLHRAT